MAQFEENPKYQKIPDEMSTAGQDTILPAVLEFPETHQQPLLRQVISNLDVNSPSFKLAPAHTLYLCARYVTTSPPLVIIERSNSHLVQFCVQNRYRVSTHYRPDLKPAERTNKLTDFLHHVANLVLEVIKRPNQDRRVLAFWMANSSELFYFLESDRETSPFSAQAIKVLNECMKIAFTNLADCFHAELSQTLNKFLSESIDNEAAAGPMLTVLRSAMDLFCGSEVNGNLLIHMFSNLFYYYNAICFNAVRT